MNKKLTLSVLLTTLVSVGAGAQEVDRTKYPDYTDKVNPDWSLMKPMRVMSSKAAQVRPDHVNNAETRYFPPVFNQAGGSCGSASRICYMFTHELNSFRDADGKDPNNYYPSHFVWLLTNGNSGKDAFIQHVGVPSAAVYGGQTYSSLFGYQEETYPDFGWMTGYDKWYSAMFNRMKKPSNFPVNVGSEEGREAVKNWLWNHNGDPDFHAGGIVGIGVASGGIWKDIPSTPINDEIGVTGKSFVAQWGKQVDHALTIVGYDDRIEFDLNGNGKFGEKSADEKGAWIIVNSWGDGWENGGFIYCPYAHAVPAFRDGHVTNDFWMPEIYWVRKNYRPLRTIKLKMDYTHRSELYLSAGVSRDLNAELPEVSQAFEHFKYAGDGANGNADPTPKVPMLGKWADGKLHHEPMEFGYDLTDLSANFDVNEPLKYFFIIETKSTAVGSGHIYEASIMDYEQDLEGVETPFGLTQEGVTIKNKGNKTIISVVVPGNGIYAPQNVAIENGVFRWDAPAKSGLTLTGYKVYQGDEELASLDATATSFTLPSAEVQSYEVAAVYGSVQSSKVSAAVPDNSSPELAINFKHSGFTIPTVFGNKYDEATIEYWVNANSLTNWNQSAGPGWGSFMFHANSDGSLTAGWDTSNRVNASNAFSVGKWNHVAIVVNKKLITLYVNGNSKGSMSSSRYSGLGGFGDLEFSSSNGNNSYQDARYDEIRIWKTARKPAEIKNNRNVSFGDAGLPEDLLAYYKGDLIKVGGVDMLRDHTVAQRHATIHNKNYSKDLKGPDRVKVSKTVTVEINKPTQPIYAGQPVEFTVNASVGASTIKWNAEGAGVKDLSAVKPMITFPKAGEYKVSVTAATQEGVTAEAELVVKVEASQAPDASFIATQEQVPAGERVSFQPLHPQKGYAYKWLMPGADVAEVTTPKAAATYQKKGNYTVTLQVTNPDGVKAESSKQIVVSEVAPIAMVDVAPGVVMKGERVVLTSKSKFAPNKWEWLLTGPQCMLKGEGERLVFEPKEAGIYDVQLTVSNAAGKSVATQTNGLVVCNADSKNGLSFTQEANKVTLTKVPLEKGSNEFTIDWWMRPGTLNGVGYGIGDNYDTFVLSTNAVGQMTLHMQGDKFSSPDNYVRPNEWHHYAIVLRSGKLRFFRDGEEISVETFGVRKLPEMKSFAIGGANFPFKGQLDEFRVWNKALNVKDMPTYINQPLEGELLKTAEAEGLQVYYQFNQSGGDVTDATSKGNTGVRSSFGPDGDAWALSKGVFCLNFEGDAENVTSYLTNTKAPFKDHGRVINSYRPNRFYEIRNWKQENMGEKNAQAHVDRDKDNNFAITTGWDAFDKSLTDHKTYQTVNLPAGNYIFTANYGAYEGMATGSYLVVGEGEGLPNTAELAEKAIAYTPMEAKSHTVTSNRVVFELAEPTKVSLGLLVNMSGDCCISLSSFELVKIPVFQIEGIDDAIHDAIAPAGQENAPVYDLYGRRVIKPTKGGIYIMGGKKVILK